eukprot:gnl/MRDRNA2_/MRDRNA2_86775_c0_seq1.p1 gnl/MRDRNA2_/MRDRNA2_86775_c0~~gnl/MRDRNA2_/MRDRNA2_86775_c0_seq1.p1  ORF type:complete len:409 (-),score=64.16 gnl/MRDRNA2_/MRDRNA2_86775_c0_seq1:105-1331(-)
MAAGLTLLLVHALSFYSADALKVALAANSSKLQAPDQTLADARSPKSSTMTIKIRKNKPVEVSDAISMHKMAVGTLEAMMAVGAQERDVARSADGGTINEEEDIKEYLKEALQQHDTKVKDEEAESEQGKGNFPIEDGASEDVQDWGMVWLHGLSERRFFSQNIYPELFRRKISVQQNVNLHVSAPVGPMKRVSVTTKMFGKKLLPPAPTWFGFDLNPVEIRKHPDLEDNSIGNPDIEEAKGNIHLVHEAIDEMVAQGIPPERIIVGGFSQGSYMSLRAVMTYPKKLAGVFMFEGSVIIPHEFKTTINDLYRDIPIVWLHGRRDFVIPIEVQSVQVPELRQMGLSVTREVCNCFHSGDPALFESLSSFINALVGNEHQGDNKALEQNLYDDVSTRYTVYNDSQSHKTW